MSVPRSSRNTSSCSRSLGSLAAAIGCDHTRVLSRLTGCGPPAPARVQLEGELQASATARSAGETLARIESAQSRLVDSQADTATRVRRAQALTARSYEAARGVAASCSREARAAADYELAFDDPDPLVSVPIPTYHSPGTLCERALASVRAQTHRPLGGDRRRRPLHRRHRRACRRARRRAHPLHQPARTRERPRGPVGALGGEGQRASVGRASRSRGGDGSRPSATTTPGTRTTSSCCSPPPASTGPRSPTRGCASWRRGGPGAGPRDDRRVPAALGRVRLAGGDLPRRPRLPALRPQLRLRLRAERLEPRTPSLGGGRPLPPPAGRDRDAVRRRPHGRDRAAQRERGLPPSASAGHA